MLMITLIHWCVFLQTAVGDCRKDERKQSYFHNYSEIEKIDSQLDNELRTVVYLIEDSLQSPQKYPGNADSLNYVHKHIMRGTIDGFTFGQELDDAHELNDDNKYYFNYSFELPSQYDPSNMHVIIYVRDAVTEEIYHVIEKSLE